MASALSLPLIVTDKDKRIMTDEEEEMSDLQKIQLEIKMKEAEKRNKADLDADIKFIWPTWNRQTITDHIRNGMPTYWLIPRASFSIENSITEQPDFPMSNKAFLYKAFVINAEVRKKIKSLDNVLINFYAQKAQPQHLVWSTSKLVDIRAVGQESWGNNILINYKFQGVRGEEKKILNFTCADLPLMNPYDWIRIHTILRKRKVERYKNYLQHIRMMLKAYISEIAKEDFGLAENFNRKVAEPNDTSDKIKDLRDGTILNDPWAVVYKTHINREYKNKIFYLNEKHLYSTNNLNTILAKMELTRRTSQQTRSILAIP